MTHKRAKIRDAIVAILSDIPGWGGRVKANRTRPTEIHELPIRLVYTLSETAALATVGRSIVRTLSVAIELRVAASSDLDAALDVDAQEVEAALAGSPKLGGLAMGLVLRSTVIGLDGEGESRQALATLTYDVQYQTDASGV